MYKYIYFFLAADFVTAGNARASLHTQGFYGSLLSFVFFFLFWFFGNKENLYNALAPIGRNMLD